MSDNDPQIDKGIPMPEKGSAGRGRIQRFIQSLEVGDSFVTSQSLGNQLSDSNKKSRRQGDYALDR